MVHTHFLRLALILAALGGVLTSSCTAYAQIINGGFETGDLSGWFSLSSGSVQVLAAGQLGSLEPAEGVYFALVSNGPGDVDNDGLPDIGMLTSSSFVITSSESYIQYSLDFMTAEFTGANSSLASLDSYKVFLLPQNGSPILLEAGDVSMPNFSSIAGGSVVSAPDGTSVLEHTGSHMTAVFLNIGTYSLQFKVADGGDGSFDSALLVDNVSIVHPSVVPESNTWIVYGSLLLSASGFLLCNHPRITLHRNRG